jgi:hypothetical protein
MMLLDVILNNQYVPKEWNEEGYILIQNLDEEKVKKINEIDCYQKQWQVLKELKKFKDIEIISNQIIKNKKEAYFFAKTNLLVKTIGQIKEIWLCCNMY